MPDNSIRALTDARGEAGETTDTVNVTSWQARRRHVAEVDSRHTLCHTVAVRPGGVYLRDHREVMTQDLIDALDLCKICERSAAKRADQAEVGDDRDPVSFGFDGSEVIA